MNKILLTIVVITLLSACSSYAKKEALLNSDFENMKITSPAFAAGEKIPSKYTCDGENINPELVISNIPEGTKSFSLIVDDPDASSTWLHWILWNISVDNSVIKENSVPEGAVEGITDFGRTGWGGPCPPSGTHRYFFKVYALDKVLDLDEGASLNKLKDVMIGHVIESGELVGLYSRN